MQHREKNFCLRPARNWLPGFGTITALSMRKIAWKANVYPHFIGVFDTVAALGNPVTTALFTLAFLGFAVGLGFVGWILTHFEEMPLFGWLFTYLTCFGGLSLRPL
jgi:hypothetical protein